MDNGAQPRDIYADRLAQRSSRLKTLESQKNRLGTLRLVVFLALATILWYAIRGKVPAASVAAPVAVFIALVYWQSRVERQAECARRAIRFYERSIARVEDRWHSSPADAEASGARFLDPHHPYTADLDIFGHASLFELLSTARTRGGEACLAAWLQSPSPVHDIRERHAAIAELRPLLDLREQLAVLGDDFRTGVNPDELAAWSRARPQPFPRWMPPFAFICALLAFAALIWSFATNLAELNAELALLGMGLVEALFAVPLRNRILSIVEAVEAPAHDLALLSQILATLEGRRFESPRLAALHNIITIEGRPASARIASLRRLIEMLDSRDNPVVRAIGPVVLWTTQLGMAIESWRAENGLHVAGWLDAVSEIEALSSLANYSWEHPEDPFPQFSDEDTLFDGNELGHPLLPASHCVHNTVTLAPPLRLLIVSGSNMSGKSTLLRSIGVNTVLALAGAPVRARSLILSPLSLGASIRTTDSLEEGQSRFMAEILRLKQILELPAPALFLLDELLGGTNSHDRAVGSEGLIRALLDRGAIGLVTTHDLSLARVAEDLARLATNVHFEDRLEEGRLVFDYKMRAGIVTRSNALDLMRAVGLDV
jgi:hypothetical protein